MASNESYGRAADGAMAAGSGANPPDRITYLPPGSSIEGTLKVCGDAEIAGSFQGPLLASGTVVVRSNFLGDIHARELRLVSCAVIGDLRVIDAVFMDADCRVKGNVFVRQIHCDGKIVGDLHINGSASFGPHADVEGRISAVSMSVECGASLQGSVTMVAAETGCDGPSRH